MDWRMLSPPNSPPLRNVCATAYDAARQRIVLFGGIQVTTRPIQHLNDTWEWDGRTWTQRRPVTSPPARTNHAMAYDAARQRVLLFGGTNLANALNDTWEWDGTTWTRKSPATNPPMRWEHAMVYDSARQRIVLFGGWGPMSLTDTWEWDGKNWLQMNPMTRPPTRCMHEMAYDPVRRRSVLFGGAY